MTEVKVGIAIGRFEPVHHEHWVTVLEPMTRECEYSMVLLGSANRCTSYKNPFTYNQRSDMLNMLFAGYGRKQAYTDYLTDTVGDDRWLSQVLTKVNQFVNAVKLLSRADTIKIYLYGTTKDGSSYYLKLLPSTWERRISMPLANPLSATTVRDRLYDMESIDTMVHGSTLAYLSTPELQEQIANYREEREFTLRYRKQFLPPDLTRLRTLVGEVGKDDDDPALVKLLEDLESRNYYPPTFVTVDAIVTYRGQVLLVKRKHRPGKGLYALPGGFIGGDTVMDGTLREVHEETRLNLRPEWAVKTKVYDEVERSLRGRTITHATLFSIPNEVEPNRQLDHIFSINRVQGADDAAWAGWVPISQALTDQSISWRMFEDHSMVLEDLLSQI